MIAILCPTRGRPDQCRRMIESVFATTKEHLEIHLYIADDDPKMDQYSELSISYGNDVFWHHGPDCSTVHKWNYLVGKTDARLLMLGADDMVFATPWWAEKLVEKYNGLQNKIHVFHLQDSRDVQGTPHPIISREYMDAMGYAFCPLFFHWYVDTWTREIAKSNNCFTHLRDYLLIHDKQSDNGKADDTHTKIRLAGWPDRDKFVNDTCQHLLQFEKERLGKTIAKQFS